MSEIVWQAPPVLDRSQQRNGRVKEFVDALKSRPGEWALYPDPVRGPSNVSVNRKRFPGTEWTSRRRPDRKYDLYARWVGES